jgi:hypothetical protein
MTERNPRYDGLHVFKPDLRELRAGDIILTKNAEGASSKGRLQSDLIARVTGGNFSHALLCTTPPTLIEAIGEGVSNISAQVCFAHDLKHVRVLRYGDQRIASAAASAAMRLFGQQYSVSTAVRSIFTTESAPGSLDDETFCSALVATAFRCAGAPKFASIDPMKVTPAVLEKADYFVNVTSQVFMRILSPNNIERMSALDGDRIASPMAIQTALFGSYYAIVGPRIRSFIASHPSFGYRNPVSFFECLTFIIDALVACNKSPHNIEREYVLAELKSIDDDMLSLLVQGKLEEMYRAAELVDEDSIRYSISESFEANPDINLVDTQGLIVSTKAQIDSRSSIFDDLQRGYSRTWDEWLRIQETVIRMQVNRLRVLQEVMARVFPGETLAAKANP